MFVLICFNAAETKPPKTRQNTAKTRENTAKTTERRAETTKAVNGATETNESDKMSYSWKIGVPVGIALLLLIGTGKSVYWRHGCFDFFCQTLTSSF